MEGVGRRYLSDEVRNAQLGIDKLWADVAKQNDVSESDSLSLDLLPVVGDEPASSRKVMPWDTTTGAHGISYLQRRMAFLRKRQQVLKKSYEECRRITALFSKTFYMGSSLLSPEKRRAVWAIYVWCRRTDDLVDGPRVPQRHESLQETLADWEQRLDDIFNKGVARDALDLALVDAVNSFPLLTPTPFYDMIEGMRMDAEQSRFETFDELYLYCYRVAGTVGLMTLPIMGATEPGRAGLRAAADSALALGIGLQLTNILRDVGEDRLRGRIYLPLEDMRRFNYSEEDLQNCVLDSRYRDLMKFEIERARSYFRKAEKGVALLAPDARLPVRASLDMYSQILDVLEENDYDNFHKRAYVSKTRKLLTVPISFVRMQEGEVWRTIARVMDFALGTKGVQESRGAS